jgi:hypothetical protein
MSSKKEYENDAEGLIRVTKEIREIIEIEGEISQEQKEKEPFKSMLERTEKLKEKMEELENRLSMKVSNK